MIRSPGLATSIADWMVVPAVITVGVLPPIVTVTVSTVLLPLAAVITNSPHCAADPPYCACCCMLHAGTEPAGAGPKPKLRLTVFALNGAVVALGPEYP